MKTVTYYSANAEPAQAWLAYIVLPNGEYWGVRCAAATEAEATSKATTLWANEQAKWHKLETAEAIQDAPIKTEGQHWFAGLKWVMNVATREKKRVPRNEVEALVSNGWVLAGPRSK